MASRYDSIKGQSFPGVRTIGCGCDFVIAAPDIGDCFGGGIVFYIFQPGDIGFISGETHGLIIAPDYFYLTGPTEVIWGCAGTDIVGNPNVTSLLPDHFTTGLDPGTEPGGRVGDGKTNTAAMITECSEPNSVIDIVSNYSAGGYNDWFIPSRGEIMKYREWVYPTFNDVVDVPATNVILNGCGADDVASIRHISSTEYDANNFWHVEVFLPHIFPTVLITPKSGSTENRVLRPMRQF